MLTGLMMLFIVAAGITLLPHKDPEKDVARVVAVGELKTNGEHWVIFRFDAPKEKAATIVNVQVIGTNNFAENTDAIFSAGSSNALLFRHSAVSFPDSTVRISELVKAGSFKLFKARCAGGGEWRVRLCLIVHLGFTKQYQARIEGCWKAKSLKPWTRNYVERGYRLIDSEVVKTTDSGRPRGEPPSPQSPTTPWSLMDEIFSQR